MKKVLISTLIFLSFICVYAIKHPLNANNRGTEPVFYDRSQLSDERSADTGSYTDNKNSDVNYDEHKVVSTPVNNYAQPAVETVEPEPQSGQITSLNENAKPATAYDYMTTNFKNHPEENRIKGTFENVLKKYYPQQNDEQRLKLASMLFYLRQQSKTGVTELEILKDINQNGNVNLSVGQQAGISFAQLEKANDKNADTEVMQGR